MVYGAVIQDDDGSLSNCCMFGIRLPWMKSTNTSPLTDPLYKSTAITPSVLMAAIADTRGPLLSNRWYTSTWSQWSEPVSSIPTRNFLLYELIHAMNPALKAMHLCFATFWIFFLVNPCLASNRHTVGAETCLLVTWYYFLAEFL